MDARRDGARTSPPIGCAMALVAAVFCGGGRALSKTDDPAPASSARPGSTPSRDADPSRSGDEPKPAAYLFAHMMKQDYGRLYYSVSRDGLRWEPLHGGRRAHGEYRGHPDICRGHDGRYYLLGNYSRKPNIDIWVSKGLVRWSKLRDFRPDASRTPDFQPAMTYHGAPKIYYDRPSGQYVITWHTPSARPDPKDPERFWASMRTLYVTSKDLVRFSDPKRLFAFDMATIDVILRRQGRRYYAFLKDERYPSYAWATGKSIRVSTAPALLGPYGRPSPRITPNFREAPTLIPKPDGGGWYLYYEQYPGVSYGLSTARTLDGPWHDVYCMKYKVPAAARHGCMIPITQTQYDAIVAAYGGKDGT